MTSNLERFAPLHTVADALIDYLACTFDVTRCEGIELAGAIEHPRDDVVRAVRLAPADARAARLTFVFASFPSVVMFAGAVQEIRFPDCGCDACDESWNTQAEEMEWQALAVAAGNFSESIKIGWKPWVDVEIYSDGASRSGRSGPLQLSKTRIRDARRLLKAVPDGWVPWQRTHHT
jgi:hypothetical protein